MTLVVPNPNVPTNGQSLDAAPLLANLQAVYQAIQQFDGAQIQANTITAAAFNANINPNTLLKETTTPFVSTGLIWSTVSGLNGTMTGGIMYYNGIRITVNSVGSNTFTASRDTYVDVDVNGNIVYQAVTIGSTAPTITASSNRIAIIGTNGSTIVYIQQLGFDNVGNKIRYSGSIAESNGPGTWWDISRVTATANTTTLTASFPAYKYLRITAFEIQTGGTVGGIFQFNGDTGANYNYRFSVNGAADSSSAISTTSIFAGGDTSQKSFIDMRIVNTAANEKLIRFTRDVTIGTGAGNLNNRVEGSGKWANTANQITTLTWSTPTNTFGTGTEFIVQGRN